MAGKGEAFSELFFEVAAYYFRLRAAGEKLGFLSKRGAGTFGFLHTLATVGPITVPDLARMRPTSRQRMQQLADDLVEEGLIEFIDNPRHRTSKLARLTRKGDARHKAMMAKLHDIGLEQSKDLSETDLRAAAVLLRKLRERTLVD